VSAFAATLTFKLRRRSGSSEDQERSSEKHDQSRDHDDEPQIIQRHCWIAPKIEAAGRGQNGGLKS